MDERSREEENRGTGEGRVLHPGTEYNKGRGMRGRQVMRMGQVCQVQGCDVLLDGMKEYHQRYKICPDHLKADYIVKNGEQLRFCQQCGRFEELKEFDEGKRSCRKRLQRHNARRRKRTRRDDSPHMMHGGVVAQMSEKTCAQVAQYQNACFASSTMEGENMSADPEAAHSATMLAQYIPLPGGVLIPRPLVPSQDVMMFYLKHFARLFHYDVRDVDMKPIVAPRNVGRQGGVDGPYRGASAQEQTDHAMQGHDTQHMGEGVGEHARGENAEFVEEEQYAEEEDLTDHDA